MADEDLKGVSEINNTENEGLDSGAAGGASPAAAGAVDAVGVSADADEAAETIEEETVNLPPTIGTEAARLRLGGMYRSWFLDYASYVILERAVPHIDDGFKPVQRRIMHSMKTLDDGRFIKVANIVGNTMQYHPHGDASIKDAQIGRAHV